MWSLDDRAYMDTLFGHQAEVLSLDVLRSERALTGGSDRSLRVWKVPEESQLVFRCARALAIDHSGLRGSSQPMPGVR
jgi:ribosomal RNA-processing protein 9